MSNLSGKVSVVICTKNVENIIYDCVKCVIKNNPKEIIVVDGCSTDETVKKIDQLDIKILSDKSKGLSFARRIGSENATGDYVLFIGPDNLIEDNFIHSYVDQLEKNNYDAATTHTRVFKPVNFWDFGLDERWKNLTGKTGKRDVIGTPGLYRKKCFTKVQFSKRDMGPCDDTLFCQRLNKEGFKIGLVPIIIYDQNNSSFSSTWNRFKWYGTGDYQFYNYNKINWDLRRRISSLLHPFFQTLKYSLISLKSFKLKCILWNFITMLARYYGWLETFTFSLNKGHK